MLQAISYRDRDGFVIIKGRAVHRYVTLPYANAYDHLMESGLYRKLVTSGLLIHHTENPMTDREKLAYYRVLSPEIIPTISRPSEWSAGQWQEVVLTFLAINKMALEYGMLLKDATPANFAFYKGHCILIDTLSFDFYKEGQPWIAYRQFCESMLGPLALIHFNHVTWARMIAVSINGWELPFTSRNLPPRTWFNLTILLHIHWHSKYSNTGKQKVVKQSSFSKQKLFTLWNMLYNSVSKWKPALPSKTWLLYYEEGIGSAAYIKNKTEVVTSWLKLLAPDRVIDLGANNGRFSLIASSWAKEVIAVESDHDCIDELYRTIREKEIANITTIFADITQPTPGAGWNNEERLPLLKRLKGDMILALALIHHLCISKNIPLSFVSQLFAGITNKYAVVEFVPKSDLRVQEMLCNREDIFDGYNEDQFIDCFSTYFILKEVHACDSSARKLFLWEKR